MLDEASDDAGVVSFVDADIGLKPNLRELNLIRCAC